MDLKSLSYDLDSLEVQKPQGYFQQTDYLSNSDLSRLDSLSRGVAYREPPRNCFEFGRAFDCYVTEPKKWNPSDYDLQDFHFEQIEKMFKSYLNSLIPFWIYDKQVEYYKQVEFEGIGTLKVRCKTDLEFSFLDSGKEVIELKTTTCSTLREFYKKTFSYAYDRAGAWYSDITDADKYTIIAINYTNDQDKAKDFKHQIWQIEFNETLMEMGRSEYERILKYAKENNLITIL